MKLTCGSKSFHCLKILLNGSCWRTTIFKTCMNFYGYRIDNMIPCKDNYCFASIFYRSDFRFCQRLCVPHGQTTQTLWQCLEEKRLTKPNLFGSKYWNRLTFDLLHASNCHNSWTYMHCFLSVVHIPLVLKSIDLSDRLKVCSYALILIEYFDPYMQISLLFMKDTNEY